MPSTFNVGLVQMQCAEDPKINLEKALTMTRDAAEKGAQVVCLPELFLSPYFCQTESYEPFKLGEPVPGPTTDAFTTLAAELDISVIVSLFEKRTAGLYHNTAAVIDGPNGYVGKYRKMHIPDDPRYYEKFYFTPGDLGFKAFPTKHATLGTLVCWDQWYPEAARLTALKGADILFYPTAIGWHREEKDEVGTAQHSAWQVSMRAHAVANGCYVVAVNRLGFEPTPGATEFNEGIEFWGQSFVVAPDGSIVVQGPVDEEAVLIAPIDLDKMETARLGWPFLRDRRIDAYAPLSARFLDEE